MSAISTLLDKMAKVLQKEQAHKELENNLDLSSEGDVGAIWYAVGKDEDDFEKFPTEGEEWDDALEKYISESFDEFSDRFENKAKEKGAKLHVSRCIGVEDVKEFTDLISKGKYVADYKGLGLFWSWDEDKAECYWGGNQKEWVTIHCLVDVSHIDIESTTFKNINPSLGEDETEIQVKKNTPLELISIEDHNDKQVWEGSQEVKAFSYVKRIEALYAQNSL